MPLSYCRILVYNELFSDDARTPVYHNALRVLKYKLKLINGRNDDFIEKLLTASDLLFEVRPSLT